MALHFFGDIGTRNQRQARVIRALTQRVEQDRAHELYPLVFGLGDWVYPHGPKNDSMDEIKRVENTVLVPFKPLTDICRVNAILGNHEYGDFSGASDPSLFMKMAQKHEIHFNGRYGRLKLDGPLWRADIIYIDSSTWPVDADQADWICEQLADSAEHEETSGQTRWRILAAHHPIESYGEHHGETLHLNQLLGPFLSLIDLSICGHEHDNEFLKATSYHPRTVVTGTGCESRSVKKGDNTLYCSNKAAFGSIILDEHSLSVSLNELEGDGTS